MQCCIISLFNYFLSLFLSLFLEHSFCELPEGTAYVSSKTSILCHIINILLDPGFNIEVTLNILDIMTQVANLSSIHPFLTQKHVIKALVGVPHCSSYKSAECLSK